MDYKKLLHYLNTLYDEAHRENDDETVTRGAGGRRPPGSAAKGP